MRVTRRRITEDLRSKDDGLVCHIFTKPDRVTAEQNQASAIKSFNTPRRSEPNYKDDPSYWWREKCLENRALQQNKIVKPNT